MWENGNLLGINHADATLLTRYKKLELKKMMDFVSSDYIKVAVQNIVSLLVGNPIKITWHKKLKTDSKFELRATALSKCFAKMVDQAIRYISCFGFVSCKIDPENGGVDIIDYNNGDIFFTIDNATEKCAFAWVRNLFKPNRDAIPFATWYGAGPTKGFPFQRHIASNCVHFVTDVPTDEGRLTGRLACLLQHYLMTADLTDYSFETERRKVTIPRYFKTTFPPMKPDEYMVFQKHTLDSSVVSSGSGDSDFLDANNLQGNGAAASAVFGGEYRPDLREMMKRMMSLNGYNEVTFDKQKNALVAGPLVDIVPFPITEASEMEDDMDKKLRDVLFQLFGCNQFVTNLNRSKVKGDAELTGTFLNPIVMLWESVLDDLFTVLAKEVLVSGVEVLAKEKIKKRVEKRTNKREKFLREREEERRAKAEKEWRDMDQEAKEDELERLTYENTELAARELDDILYDEILQSVVVKMDPVFYVSDGSREMMLGTTLPFKNLARSVYGAQAKSFGELDDVVTIEAARLELEREKFEFLKWEKKQQLNAARRAEGRNAGDNDVSSPASPAKKDKVAKKDDDDEDEDDDEEEEDDKKSKKKKPKAKKKKEKSQKEDKEEEILDNKLN